MRLFRYAALEAVVFGVLLLGAYGVLRWRHAAPSPAGTTASASPMQTTEEAETQATPGPGGELTTEAIPEHSETLPEETEVPTPAPTPYPAIDLKRLMGRDVQVTVYEVKMGENYWSVAKKNKIDVQTLIGANPEMPFVSRVHQSLLVPSRKGVLHAVAKGEDLKLIAQIYDVKIEDLKKCNAIPWWHGLKEGDVLFIPNVKPLRMNEQWREYFSKRGMFGFPFANWGKGWSSKFGYRSDPFTGERKMHKGMDFRAKYGADVFAAATGSVIFAGVAGGYGNLIQVKHPNGYITMYGHLSKILVHQGQHVRRGQLIGKVGATGRVTGPHLHFEIRKNGKAINPLPLI